MAISNTTNQLTVNNLQISPLEGINFPANLTLNVRIRVQDPITGINLDHFKRVTITINRPIFDQQARQTEVNTINGIGNTITNSMTANYDVLAARLEREAIFRALEKADGPKFNKLKDKQKEDLYQEIRNMYWASAGIPRG